MMLSNGKVAKMPDKKLTDSEIVKALEDEIHLAEYVDSDYCSNTEVSLLKSTIDLINRLQAENKSQSIMIKMLNGSIEDYKNSYINQKAEIERLKNAYEQVAWERDIFAEDMKQEIKKDCSYLMLDIKTIKAEAYKEFSERVKKLPYYPSYTNLHKAVDNLLKEIIGE